MIKTQLHKRRWTLLAVLAVATSMAASAQITIPASSALPVSAADASKPGFLWRVHQSAVTQPTTLARTEAQLAGQLGENVADPAANGGADAPAPVPDPGSTAPIEFVVSTSINFDQGGAEGVEHGSVLGDTQMPGIPGTGSSIDNIAAEVLTWLELPAGEIVMGVNSDDGFRLTIGGASPTDRFGVNVGEYDGGRGVADTIMRFTITQAGLYAARLIYNEGGSDASVEWWSQNSAGTNILINNVTEGGIKAYRAIVGSAAGAALTKVSPGISQTEVAPNAPISIELTEGSTVVDPTSVKIALDGTVVSAPALKNGNIISASYTNATLYAPNSVHQVAVSYIDGTVGKTNSWSFTVAGYGTLPPATKVTPDTTKPGFLWNFFANSTVTTASSQRAEDALNGVLKDGDGNLLVNNADPANRGAAVADATAANPANAPLKFEIPGVLNLTQVASDEADNKNGNFTPDLQMPGVPAGDTEGLAAEVLTYIELPAGVITMGVNSDDGFVTTGGNPLDAFGAIRLGVFEGGRTAADTIFSFVVQEAGVYAFRTLYYESIETANIEWFSVKADGSKVLINDSANGGYKAYRAIIGGTQPVIKSVTPTPIDRITLQASPALTITIVDGTNPVNENSITLTIDGQPVNAVKNRSGGVVTVTYTPTTLAMPYEAYNAELTFVNVAGDYTRTQAWTFRNLRNIVLPAPVLTENFDSYTEGESTPTIPTGWVATNYTTTAVEGLDPGDLNSDYYKGWVVITRERIETLKNRVLNVQPGQTFNGEDVTTLSEGNILYMESDVRGDNQVGFIVTKPFDFTAVTNVVMSFSSLYEQNQDNIGALEYSIDGGASWLPVLYYIDGLDGGGDILYRTDGTADAVATLNRANADTANWTENGVDKGDKYGDAILAPITSALDTYIAPRSNDNPTVDKLIEVVRLPQAGGKNDVRLRFSYIGTGSWYWGVDNLAFYEGPAATTPPVGDSSLTITKSSEGQINLSWTGSGTLESADAITGAWSPHSSQANPQTVTATGIAKFFRIRGN